MAEVSYVIDGFQFRPFDKGAQPHLAPQWLYQSVPTALATAQGGEGIHIGKWSPD